MQSYNCFWFKMAFRTVISRYIEVIFLNQTSNTKLTDLKTDCTFNKLVEKIFRLFFFFLFSFVVVLWHTLIQFLQINSTIFRKPYCFVHFMLVTSIFVHIDTVELTCQGHCSSLAIQTGLKFYNYGCSFSTLYSFHS